MAENFLPKFDNRIFWLLKILLGSCLLMPFLASSRLLFPYTAPKAFAFRIVIEVAAVLYFYLALKFPVFRPKKTALVLSVSAFLFIWFVAALAGADFYASFWGGLDRMMGFWGLLHFFLFFLILASIFRTSKEWRFLLKLSVAVSSLIALLAVFQRFINLGELTPQVERVYGLIGNAGFLASYLIFNIFFAGYLFFSENSSNFWSIKRLSYAVAVFLQALALLFSGTRGAFLGLAAGGLFLLIIFSLFHQNKKFKKYSLAVLFSIIVLGGLLFFSRSSVLVQSNQVLRRLTDFSLSDATTQTRFILWQKAWSAWQERPILGWGPENFGLALNQNFDSRLAPFEAWYDRAHNFFFDYGVSLGWLGLLNYLAIAGLAIFYLFKIRRKNFYLASIFISLIIAYLVQNFFIFDAFISFLMLFFVLAWLNFFIQKEEAASATTGPKMFGPARKILTAIAALAVILSIYSLNIKAIYASALASRVFSTAPENFDAVNAAFQRSLNFRTFAFPEIAYQATFDYLAKINSAPQLTQNENFYKLASGALLDSIARSPAQTRNYIALSWLNLYFSGSQPDRMIPAMGLANQARELAPAKKDAYLILVAAYAMQGNNNAAQAVVNQATQIDERLGQEINQYWQNFK